ncbi:MAG: hypothetical protein GWN41_11440 [Phycisphaerae bacterium]|nr:hypothetical protein [Phycisphaerae bacterium]
MNRIFRLPVKVGLIRIFPGWLEASSANAVDASFESCAVSANGKTEKAITKAKDFFQQSRFDIDMKKLHLAIHKD